MRFAERLTVSALFLLMACAGDEPPAISTARTAVDAAAASDLGEVTPSADASVVDTTSTGADAEETGPSLDAAISGQVGSDAAAAPVGCTPVLSPKEMAAAAALSPLPTRPPADTTNKYAESPAAALLGQRLFWDTSYAGPLQVGDDGTNGALGKVGEVGKLSCASCHDGSWLQDTRSKPGDVSLGAAYLGRNALGLINSSYYRWTNWAGRFSAQWELPLGVSENAANMNSSRLRIAHVMFDGYRAQYENIFGAMEPALGTDLQRFPAAGKPKAVGAPDGVWEAMADADRLVVNTIFVNFGKALEAYLRTLTSTVSRFDRFVAGESGTLNEREQRGLAVFVGKGHCTSCHGGPNFTDDLFHATGVPQTGPHVPAVDNGRFADLPALLASPFNTAGAFSDDRNTDRLAGLTLPPPDSTKGQFRTPSLRNVAGTAPYMHAGQFATLAEVVDFYDRGGGPVPPPLYLHPLGLTGEEKAELVEFLGTLTSELGPGAMR